MGKVIVLALAVISAVAGTFIGKALVEVFTPFQQVRLFATVSAIAIVAVAWLYMERLEMKHQIRGLEARLQRIKQSAESLLR